MTSTSINVHIGLYLSFGNAGLYSLRERTGQHWMRLHVINERERRVGIPVCKLRLYRQITANQREVPSVLWTPDTLELPKRNP